MASEGGGPYFKPMTQTLLAETRRPPAMADTRAGRDDYAIVRDAIEFISRQWREQPSLADIAEHVGLSVFALDRLFARWAGLTPKAFLQAVTLDHARRLLPQAPSLLDASYELGLSGPGRLHDLFVQHETMSPGAYRSRGAGVTLEWGVHPSPFGQAILIAHGGRLAGLGFVEADGEAAAIEDFRRRWPAARFSENPAATAPIASRIFDPQAWQSGEPLRIVMIGSDFEIRVWETLLGVRCGSATSYAEVAARIGNPKAARAVGAAVGRNPISFVVPCHRVLGSNGSLTGYHWGLTRKRAMLGWEAGVLAGAAGG